MQMRLHCKVRRECGRSKRYNGVIFAKWCSVYFRFPRPFLHINAPFCLASLQEKKSRVCRYWGFKVRRIHTILSTVDSVLTFEAYLKCKFSFFPFSSSFLLYFSKTRPIFSRVTLDLYFSTSEVNIFNGWKIMGVDIFMIVKRTMELKIHAKENKCHLIE